MGTVENDALFILFIISIAQVGEVLWGQIIVSARKMWAQSLKRATLWLTAPGWSRSMNLRKIYG